MTDWGRTGVLAASRVSMESCWSLGNEVNIGSQEYGEGVLQRTLACHAVTLVIRRLGCRVSRVPWQKSTAIIVRFRRRCCISRISGENTMEMIVVFYAFIDESTRATFWVAKCTMSLIKICLLENLNHRYGNILHFFVRRELAGTISAATVSATTTENWTIDFVFDVISSLALAAPPPNH